MKNICLLLCAAVLVTAFACSKTDSMPSPVSTGGSLAAQNDGPMAATMLFGRDELGSPFPPGSGHDQSGHSRDSVFPKTVIIKPGGTVTFKVGSSGVHKVTIYDNGIDDEDIDSSLQLPAAAGCPPVPTVNDPNHRLAIFPQVCAGGPAEPTYTFDNPGKYLVICSFLPHFQLNMYGFVVVKE